MAKEAYIEINIPELRPPVFATRLGAGAADVPDDAPPEPARGAFSALAEAEEASCLCAEVARALPVLARAAVPTPCPASVPPTAGSLVSLEAGTDPVGGRVHGLASEGLRLSPRGVGSCDADVLPPLGSLLCNRARAAASAAAPTLSPPAPADSAPLALSAISGRGLCDARPEAVSCAGSDTAPIGMLAAERACCCAAR